MPRTSKPGRLTRSIPSGRRRRTRSGSWSSLRWVAALLVALLLITALDLAKAAERSLRDERSDRPAGGEHSAAVVTTSRSAGMSGFLLGAGGMLATMYSTQAILPELAHRFHVSAAEAGLTVSVVVLAVAAGAWVWGPLSDRYGRKQSLVAAAALLVLPTIGTALAPSFETLLLFRALQGLCMPGLLAVGVPYVAEAFVPRHGSRAMGYYVSALIAGGLVGRVGVALVTAAVGWRTALGLLAALPLTGAVIMQRSLIDLPLPERSEHPRRGIVAQFTNAQLLRATAAGCAFVFTFVATFSYATFRLEKPPFGYGTIATSLIFLLWLLGGLVPFAGRLAERIGWRGLALGALALAAGGILLSFPDFVPTLVPALAAITLANFVGVTAAQLGVSEATTVDRGLASAFYFSVYYTVSALGAYIPGLAWQSWGWTGVAILSLGVLAFAAAATAAPYDQGYGECETGWRSPVSNRSKRNG